MTTGQTDRNDHDDYLLTPRETLARLAEASKRDDARMPVQEDIDFLIAYLSMSKQLGSLTYKQMDAFWELNRKLVEAHEEIRYWYKGRPAYDAPDYLELEVPKDRTASDWMAGLSVEEYEIVAKAAYAQFEHVFDEMAREPTPRTP